MQDAMTMLLFLFALEVELGAPPDALIARLETWPSAYVPMATA